MCGEHSEFLQNSTVERIGHADQDLIPAEQMMIGGTTARRVALKLADHCALLNAAKDAGWLLKQSNLTIGFERLHASYINILAENGFTINRKVRLQKLCKAFFSHYSPDLLALLQCNQNEAYKRDWLRSLVYGLKSNRAFSPIRHLLLIQFLGYTAESFFALASQRTELNAPIKDAPFGLGPWPCLNPASDHYKERLVTQCSIRFKERLGTLVGIFSCLCGFVYRRRGPDSSPNDQFRKQNTLCFGPVWEIALIKLWHDHSLSDKSIAIRLRVALTTVRYQAIRLGLPIQRPESTTNPAQIAFIHDEFLRKTYEARINKIMSYRNEWLVILKENPMASRSSLEINFKRVFHLLKRHDNDWLQDNLPRPRRKKPAPFRIVDWAERDVRLSREVRHVALRLRSATGRPVRITSKLITKELERPLHIRREILTKLPLTISALSEVIESPIDFAVRRIYWTAKCLREDEIPFTLSTLMSRANVWPIKNIKEVRTAIEAVFPNFQEFGNSANYQAV
jgi:hypothetical protein